MTACLAVLGVASSFAVVATAPAHAEVIIQVTTTADDGPGSLRAALAQAEASASDDQITFAPSVTGTIQLTSGELDVAVGGSSGNLTIDGPGRDVLAIDADWQSRVLDVRGGTGDTRPTVVVSGLRLSGGAAFQYGDADGGALRATGTDLTLNGMVISDNRASESGGGVSLEGGSLLVTASMIMGNSSAVSSYFYEAAEGGGGIFFDGGEATGTELVVNDSVITDNTAHSRGGGIHSPGASPVSITRSTVTGNAASYTYSGSGEIGGVLGIGGGIAAHRLTLIDSSVTGNVAGRLGGGVDARKVVVNGSTIADNVARAGGGGVHVSAGSDGDLRLDSSTVTGNRGGGLYVGSDVTAEVRLSTIAANARSGLISHAHVAVIGTIVAMNEGGDLAGSGSATLNHSLVYDPRGFAPVDSGGSIIGADPRLGPLADNGGPTPTMLPASNSPAIDQGAGFGATTDQREVLRPVDDADTPDAVDGADMGAIELTQAELAGPPQVGNTARPTITGRPRVGETLHTDGGAWAPEDATLSYQWLRSGTPIPGATSASYTLTPDDHARMWYGAGGSTQTSVRVTASAPGHRGGSMVSDPTRPVRKGVVEVSRPAEVTGKLKVGSVLRAKPHVRGVSPHRRGVTVIWYLDGRHVRDAYDEMRLQLDRRMRGKRVRVVFEYTPPRGYKQLVQVVEKQRRVR